MYLPEVYNESDQTNIATFTKEGVSRKYYNIHIQPISEIKLMQILFEPSNKSSYECFLQDLFA